MATPTTKSAAIEALLPGRRDAIKSDRCIDTFGCGGPATEFRDALSAKEYRISGLCQTCQDGVFGSHEEEE